MKNAPFYTDQTKGPATLSVCLIVKDEERVLGRCLSAAVQFADELIVLDTGSKDRSREIAGEYTALVFSEPWQNSFARARNFVASKASCDYVMWLDADDVMYPEEIQKLIDLKSRLTPRTDVVFTTYRNYGFPSDMGLRDRIHRRKLACRWLGDVHEAIIIDDSMNLLFCPEITIIHKKEHINEPNRNIRIFDDVRSAGRLSGAYMLSYYCRELAVRDYTDRALAAWRELLSTNPSPHRVQYALVFMTGMLIRQRAYDACRQLIDTAVEQYHVPLSAFLCYHLGLAAEGLGDIGEAERQYRRATELPVDIMSCMIEFSGYDDYLPCLKLCALAYDRGEIEASEAWNSRAGEAWPEGTAWRINRERFFTPPLSPGREPLVSVIMPVCDMAATASEAVSSILDQSWLNFELIVVDDASTDATRDVIRGFSDPRIRLLENDRRRGVAASINRAIGASGGEYLALMDGDAVSLPDRLKAQLTFLEHNGEIMVLGTASLPIDRKGSGLAGTAPMPGSPGHYQAKLLTGNLEFRRSSTMLRRSFLVENRLSYREDMPGMQDYRFFMEASKLGRISCLADFHLYFRHDGDGLSAETRREVPAERARLYNSVRCDSLRMSGARLSEQDQCLLGQLLPEDGLPLWNRREREKLVNLFSKIREQLAAQGFPAIRELDEILFSILNH